MKSGLPPDGATLFPADCRLKIIVVDDAAVVGQVRAALDELGIAAPLQHGRTSAAGRYLTLEVQARLDSAETLRAVVARLGQVSGVKMVL